MESQEEDSSFVQRLILTSVLKWIALHSNTQEGQSRYEYFFEYLKQAIPFIHASQISMADFGQSLLDSHFFPAPLIHHIFFQMGIIIDSNTLCYQKSEVSTRCPNCHGTGRNKVPKPQNTPCSCIAGEVIKLKDLFDKKFLKETFPRSTYKFLKNKNLRSS